MPRLRSNDDDPAARARVLARAADAALEVGPPARERLPDDLRPGFDLILRAFALNAEGKEEEARETLQGIGLQSPFLEWKLLLRGLMAFQARDDVRACENWQRLNPDRLPFRLAAPLRVGIDAAFAAVQAPATQHALRKASDGLLGSADLIPSLRVLQTLVAQSDRLTIAFRVVKDILPILRQRRPDLLPRLQTCLFWAVVQSRDEENLKRFVRTFAIPSFDPDADRLAALFWDEQGDEELAYEHWHAFEQAAARQPERWSAGQGNRMRAIVLEHMAELASFRAPEKSRALPDAAKMTLDSEACLKQSIELAPDRRAPYLALLNHYESEGKAGANKADKLAQSIVERFPDEGSVWESLGDRASVRGALEKTVEYYGQALKYAPLSAHIRQKTAGAHLLLARKRARSTRVEAGRTSFGEAFALALPESRGRILALWATAEAGWTEFGRSEELLAQGDADAATRLPARYTWLVDAIRRKRGKVIKGEADKRFQAALAEGVPPIAVVGALHSLAVERADGKYVGQGVHEKKIFALLNLHEVGSFTENQLEQICEVLKDLAAYSPLRQWAQTGQQRFPQNPFLALAEAWSYLAAKGRNHQPWAALEPLQRARALADAIPDGSTRRRLFAVVLPLLNQLLPRAPFGPLAEIMEVLGNIDPDDFDPSELDAW
jgi:hypothetical protein